MSFRRTLQQRHSLFVSSSLESPREPIAPSDGNIEVCVRVRPLLEPYEDEVVWDVDETSRTVRTRIDNIDLRSLNLSHSKFYNDSSSAQRFAYDNVEGPGSKNKDIYNKLFKKIVNSVVEGYNGTIFMYGQTTSGKTYTMLGTQKDPGVLPHSLRTVFQEISKMEGYAFTVSISYLEIYNEVINDLLVPDASNLKIVDDPRYGVIVKGLKRQEVTCFEDAIFLMSFGEEHRKYRETNANEHSSRSHTIYQVFIESFQEIEDQAKIRRFSCLNLVDLAGSERLSDNGGTNDIQTGETGHINKSLFILTNVIKKLSDGKTSHIPYRDSKLTRILSNALGGNSLTGVICTISPALQNYAQTLSTLRFASRAKKVKNDPTVNLVEEGLTDKRLKDEVVYLREQLKESQGQVSKVSGLNIKLEQNLHSTKQEIRILQKEMEELRAIFIRESSRQQGEDNLSSGSLLDIIEGVPMTKSRSNKKSSIFINGSPFNQSSEMFFGDQILSGIEQIINDSTAVTTNLSLDESPNVKEWSAHCLKAKHNYLNDLRLLQQNYSTAIEDISQKFIPKSQNAEIETTIKNHVNFEFQKLEAVQSRITDAIKRISPTSMKEITLEKPISFVLGKRQDDKDQPNQTWDTQNESSFPDPNVRQYYDNVLNRIEKKYNDIYTLVTQSFVKGQDSLVMGSPDQTNGDSEKRLSYYASSNPSPVHERSRYEQSNDDSMISRNNEIPAIKLNDLHSRPLSRFSEGPNSGRTLMRLESMFSKFKHDNAKEFLRRKSASSSLTEFLQGNVYLWGSGKDGRLGNGRSTNESNPISIRDLKFSKVVCGYHNTFGISTDGLVYGWGRNENGQLGVGNTMNTPIPVNITHLNKITIVNIACGWQHSLALSNTGRLFSWGCGDEGQLGHGDNFELISPAEIKFFEKAQVTLIASGHSQSAAVTNDGTLYTWGHNSDCRLMNSHQSSSFYIPTLTEFHKYKTLSQEPEEDLEICSVSMGSTHMCLVTANGKVFAAGRGSEGQLGKRLTSEMKNVLSFNHEVDEENEEVLCSYLLQLDTFDAENRAVMVACGERYSLVLNDKKLVYSFGDPSDGCLGYDEKDKAVFEPRIVESLADKNVKFITAGPRHAACLTESGDLYCWGFNYYDQLEVGEIEKNYHIPKKIDKFSRQSVVAVSCGYFHSASLVS